MTICLASTWHPRGEFPRLQKLLPQLQQPYSWMVVVLPPDVDATLLDALNGMPSVKAVRALDWPAGRQLALQEALETPAAHIHYADLDRLLRWVETRSAEWRQTLEVMQRSDYLASRTQATLYALKEGLASLGDADLVNAEPDE